MDDIRCNFSYWTWFAPKLCLTTSLFDNCNNAARCSTVFGLPWQSFTRISFSSARHLFDHWGIFCSIFLGRILNYSTWESLFNQGSIVYIIRAPRMWGQLQTPQACCCVTQRALFASNWNWADIKPKIWKTYTKLKILQAV